MKNINSKNLDKINQKRFKQIEEINNNQMQENMMTKMNNKSNNTMNYYPNNPNNVNQLIIPQSMNISPITNSTGNINGNINISNYNMSPNKQNEIENNNPNNVCIREMFSTLLNHYHNITNTLMQTNTINNSPSINNNINPNKKEDNSTIIIDEQQKTFAIILNIQYDHQNQLNNIKNLLDNVKEKQEQIIEHFKNLNFYEQYPIIVQKVEKLDIINQ